MAADQFAQVGKDPLGQLAASLRRVGPRVVTSLAEVALDPASPATARVQAGRVILDALFRRVELVEIEERLRKLEQQGTDNDENG